MYCCCRLVYIVEISRRKFEGNKRNSRKNRNQEESESDENMNEGEEDGTAYSGESDSADDDF